ncbi:molybdopterin-dependent oxidoreductase [Aquicoccus sp. SU-CL01552]|uniref:molybdopterin-dependent oxidoreductase n=1 Tax=Aquicoccus sp. SU-CL01552 TaxID=3127656 RepID=UPI0031098E04
MYRVLCHVAAVVALSAAPLRAGELAAPEGDVILTVTGAITTTNDGDSARFDLGMLEALEDRSIETATIWTEGTKLFQGVSLSTLVDTLGIEGDRLRATAINDYTVEIPLSDAVEGGPMIAYRMDGEVMSVRNKGPLWIVYPYDGNSDYRTEVIYSRSIWQLDRIEAVE